MNAAIINDAGAIKVASQRDMDAALVLAKSARDELQLAAFQTEANQLWGHFQEQRLAEATALDANSINGVADGEQALALAAAKSVRDELSQWPGSNVKGESWAKRAESGWQRFQQQRLKLATELDETAALAADEARADQSPSASIGTGQAGSIFLSQLQHQNAYSLARQAHSDWPQPDGLAQFFDRRAERAEYAEQLGAGVLWRLRSLAAQPKAARTSST